MKEQLISLETAKLAKEKGFNIEVKTYFDIKKFGDKPCEFYGRLNANDYNSWDDKLKKNINAGYISAPTQSLLQKWLREVYNIHIAVLPKILPSNEIKYYCFKGKIKKDFKDLYNTYEEVLEKGLQEALKLI